MSTPAFPPTPGCSRQSLHPVGTWHGNVSRCLTRFFDVTNVNLGRVLVESLRLFGSSMRCHEVTRFEVPEGLRATVAKALNAR
jgi:hypothetical protein